MNAVAAKLAVRTRTHLESTQKTFQLGGITENGGSQPQPLAPSTPSAKAKVQSQEIARWCARESPKRHGKTRAIYFKCDHEQKMGGLQRGVQLRKIFFDVDAPACEALTTSPESNRIVAWPRGAFSVYAQIPIVCEVRGRGKMAR